MNLSWLPFVKRRSAADRLIGSINNSLTQTNIVDAPTLEDYEIASVDLVDDSVIIQFTPGQGVSEDSIETHLAEAADLSADDVELAITRGSIESPKAVLAITDSNSSGDKNEN